MDTWETQKRVALMVDASVAGMGLCAHSSA